MKNGTSHGQKQALCRACGSSVTVRYGTAYWDLNAEPEIFEMAIRALAEGNALRSTARIVQIDKDTACAWLHRAAQHCRLVMLSLWPDLPVAECQLDELWSFVHTKEQHLDTAKQFCATYGDAWVWIAFAPVWRVVLAFVAGQRSQASANLLLERVAHVTAAGIPFFTSDQLAEYRTALLHVYGQWQQPKRNGDRGRYPHRRRVPPPDLLYAQVVKQRERGEVVAVTRKVVFGAADAIQARLATLPTSTTVNTSFVERENLTLRQHNRRLTRKTNGFSKELSWLAKQLWLALAYYHLVLPHDSLRQPLNVPAPTRGSGSARQWRLITPAMAAGMTDHVWTTRELLSYRVPVSFLDTLHTLDHLFPPLEGIHQGS
ncbi:MAG TPA: helix-turn-helix domain-containing protein [Herpetosiphonaceae bacterium]|nr:helix-turn-helix domain-containing protein [Herpetosiphonaceae bacterium]